MKNLLLSVFTLVLLSRVDAQQPFTHLGTMWHYGNPDQLGTGLETFYTYKALKDTSIAGDIYSKIAYKNYNDSAYGNSEFLTKSNDSIYYISPSKGKLLLFKTGVNFHDTIAIDLSIPFYADSIINSRVVIDRIVWIKNSIVGSGDSISQWQFHAIDNIGGSTNTGMYTDKIVTNLQISNPEFIVLLERPVIPEGNPYLRCYQDTQYLFRPVGYGGTMACDFQNVGLKEFNSDIRLTMFPNPVHDEVNFYFEKGYITHVMIYDLTGKLIANHKTSGKLHQENIDVSTLKSGLYQCIIETDAGKTTMPLSIK